MRERKGQTLNREAPIKLRQFMLFGVVVLAGLLFTAFTAREVYFISVTDARENFRSAASRYLDEIVVDIQFSIRTAILFHDMATDAQTADAQGFVRLIQRRSATNNSPSSLLLALEVTDPSLLPDAVATAAQITGEEGGQAPIATDHIATWPAYYIAYTSGAETTLKAGTMLPTNSSFGRLLDTVSQSGVPAITTFMEDGNANKSDTARLLFANTLRLSGIRSFLVRSLDLSQLAQTKTDASGLVEKIVFSVPASDEQGASEVAPDAAIQVAPPEVASDARPIDEWRYVRRTQSGEPVVEVVATATNAAYEINLVPMMRVVVVGLLLTAILAALIYVQMRRSGRVVEIVNRRTRALKEAHSELESHYKLLQNLNRDVEDARKAAEAANLAKSEFLATMSHELRTPLNAILGFSEILESETLGPIGDGRYIEYAKDIHNSGKHLLSIINDILDLAKLEAGRVEIERKPVDPRVLGSRVVGLLAHQAEEKSLNFTMDIDESVPKLLLGDELRLRQVLINLASNAIKFTTKGSVTLRMHAKPFKSGQAGWILEVQDTGIGIPEDKQSILFDRFTQVDTTHSRRHGGVGLGLAICRELVDRMDGIISVRSIQNVGTTIRVQLPLDEAASDIDDGALI